VIAPLILTLVTTAIGSSAPERDLFGVCIDGAGDLDGDGVPDVWVGDPPGLAYEEFHWAPLPGRVWAVSGRTGATVRRIDSPAQAWDFGWTLASIADVDRDGVRDVAVGCLFFSTAEEPEPTGHSGDVSPRGSAAVHLLSGATGVLLSVVIGPAETLKVPYSTSGAGPALASVGDWNNDGAGDLAIGWSHADSGKQDCGRVDVVSGVNGSTLRSWVGLEPHDRFGFALVSLSDRDGDGQQELAAAAVPDLKTGPHEPESIRRTRSGYVKILSSKGGVLSSFHAPDGSRRFGYSLATYAETADRPTSYLLVGQPHEDPARYAVTRWSLSQQKPVQHLFRPRFASRNGGWMPDDVAPGPPIPDESFGTRVLAVPDRDGDGLRDILVTEPRSFDPEPGTVVSSRTGSVLGRVRLDAVRAEFTYVGIGACLTGDVDGDQVEDFALSGANIRCGMGCQGTVILVSGKTLEVLRWFVRRGRT
jgi:hypothetical protein